MQNLFDNKRLVPTPSTWIERAVQQKHPRLILGIAHSKVLTYDRLDRITVWLPKQIWN